jgi:hypothetical protein
MNAPTTTPTSTPTSTIASTIDAYLAAYGEPDKAKRTEAVKRIWALDGELIDPPLMARGHAQIIDQADALLSQFPGHSFKRASGVDVHHGRARYAWHLINPHGGVALEGTDFAQWDDSGRLTQVTGFFGPPPAIEAVQ